MVDHPPTFNSCIGVNLTWCLENEQISNTVNNNFTTDVTTYISSGELAVMVTKGVALGFIVLLTIGGNILVLVAVMFNLHLRSSTNYFIVNLAVADLLLGTTVLPFSASLEVLGRWSFGQVFCDVWAAVDVLCCTASIMSLCVISLDRYIGVSRPLTYTTIMTEKRSILFIFFIWIASIIISVGPLFGWKEPPSEDESECNVTSQPGYVLFSVSGSFYIPTCVILIVYARIYRAAVRQTRFLERGIKTTKASGGSIESSGASGSTSEVTLRVHTGGVGTRLQSCDNLNLSPSCLQAVSGQQGRLAKFKRQKKAAKTLGIVVGVFILCWFPFFFILPLSKYV
uniref:G-protein coupled receptors family 1 profile domain-containing protein n=1 Tax=Strigamia maritima TaxID=126957 RepID=T1IJG9_STRMM